MPKISVCIPTFNRAHFLPEAIASVQAQGESDWELIVCDDGSRDETYQVMERIEDPRIRYIRHPQKIGKSNNMRSGYEAATGKYFVKFDDDDRLMPDFLEKTSRVLDENPSAGLVATDHWVMDEMGKIQYEWSQTNSEKWGRSQLKSGMLPDLLNQVFVIQSLQIGATLWRSDALRDLDYMRQDWQNCEDNDLFVRFALSGRSAYYLSERLMAYRFHTEQQGIDRAIPYLTDKLNYLDAYRFEEIDIESIRRSRFSETQLLLGLRLIEQGETDRGRELVHLGRSASKVKAIVGLILSHLPKEFRRSAFRLVRSILRK
jgi:glycosyltransferase involved in cell wall biosynthesis